MSRLLHVSCSLQTGRKGTDSWKKAEGGEDGGSGTQTLPDTPPTVRMRRRARGGKVGFGDE